MKQLCPVCQKVYKAAPNKLRIGQATTCSMSCYKTQKGTADGSAAARKLSINRCRLRRKGCTLEDSEILALFRGDCFYCGQKASESHEKVKGDISTRGLNGIDRVDNAGGYTRDNVVSCCRACNELKSDLAIEKLEIFQERALKIVEGIRKFRSRSQPISC